MAVTTPPPTYGSTTGRFKEWARETTSPQVTRENPFGLGDHDDFYDAKTYDEWQKQHIGRFDPEYPPSADGVETMANKFLPFIVDSSTPKHIFKTLMSRSKGMNHVLIASVFNLTLNIDIKRLRKTVKDLPEMPLENIYEELLQKFEQYRVDEDVLSYFRGMLKFMPKSQHWWSHELDEFGPENIMTFLYVISIKGPKDTEYSEIDFHEIHNCAGIFKRFKEHVTFTDDGVLTVFDNANSLKTFILYHAVLRNQMESDTEIPAIKAEFNKKSKSTKAFNDYKKWAEGEEKKQDETS